MRFRVYMRLARTPRAREGFKVDASPSPKHGPLTMGSYQSEALHTLRFVLALEIPNELLRPADWPTIEVTLAADALEQVPLEVEAIAPGEAA